MKSSILAAVAIAVASAALWTSMKKPSVVDMLEFAKLNGDLKSMYRDHVLGVAMPDVVDEVNKRWTGMRPEDRTAIDLMAREYVRKEVAKMTPPTPAEIDRAAVGILNMLEPRPARPPADKREIAYGTVIKYAERPPPPRGSRPPMGAPAGSFTIRLDAGDIFTVVDNPSTGPANAKAAVLRRVGVNGRVTVVLKNGVVESIAAGAKPPPTMLVSPKPIPGEKVDPAVRPVVTPVARPPPAPAATIIAPKPILPVKQPAGKPVPAPTVATGPTPMPIKKTDGRPGAGLPMDPSSPAARAAAMASAARAGYVL
jgi:hypothetical protein